MLSRLLGRVRHDLLIRNALTLMVHTALGSVFGLLFWILASHRQSPTELGLASAVIALLPLAATIGALGLDAAVFRHFALSPNRRQLINRSIVISASVSTLVGFVFGFPRPGGGALSGSLITAVAAGALGVNAVTSSTIVASRRTSLLLVEGLVGAVVKLSALVMLPPDRHGLLGAAVAGIVASSVTSAVVVYGVLRPGHNPAAERQRVTGYAVSNWVASSFSLFPFAVLPALVVWRAGAQAAAFVAVAALVSPLLRLIPTMITRSFFAEVAAAPEKLGALVGRTYRMSLATTALAAAALAVVAPFVLTLFGETYRDGSTALVRYLALATTVAVANYLADAVLNLAHDHRAFMFTNITGMVCLTALLVFASPYGATGIGIAWVAGESLYAAIAWTIVFIRHGDRIRKPDSHH